MEGFLKLSRKFFSNEMWNEAREFSESEAWIDLLQSACWSTGKASNGRLIGGREVSYTRGQYPASVSYLQKKWGWKTERKVRSFLDKLKRKGMITVDSTQGINIITIVKYDEYNPPPSEERQALCQGERQTIDKDNELFFSKLDEVLTRHASTLTSRVTSTLQEFTEKLTKMLEEERQANVNNKKNILNNNIIQETPTYVGAKKDDPPKPTPYENLQQWMEENTPHVLKMDSPITEKQYQKLKEKYRYEQLVEILQAMENYKDLCKKYTSAYLTFLKWAKKEYGT